MEKEITAFVPAHLCDSLQPGRAGEVLLVTSSGIYLRMEEQILLLCDRSWGILPIGIGLENFDDAMSALQPRQGETVRVTEAGLEFPGETVRLNPQNKSVGASRKDLPQLPRIRQAAEALVLLKKARGFSMLAQPLVLGQPLAEEPETNPYRRYAAPYFSQLADAIVRGDEFAIGDCVKKLLGLGPGLTPSADDVFLGMLYVFRALPEKCPEGVSAFRESIARLCPWRTNQISGAYLSAILVGAPFERMESVYRGLCGTEPLDIQRLIQIGSSSGSEMLLGMLIALRICGYGLSQEE